MHKRIPILTQEIRSLVRSGIDYQTAERDVLKKYELSAGTMVEIIPGHNRPIGHMMPSLIGVHIPN